MQNAPSMINFQKNVLYALSLSEKKNYPNFVSLESDPQLLVMGPFGRVFSRQPF